MQCVYVNVAMFKRALIVAQGQHNGVVEIL